MGNSKACIVCTSPYRKEIDILLKKGIVSTEIANAFYDALKEFVASPKNLALSIRNHQKKKHPPKVEDILQKPIIPISKNPLSPDTKQYPKTVEGWAQKLLDMGFEPEILGKLKPSDIVAAQRLLIEKEKLKLQNDALKLAMLKFMSGLSDEEDLKVIQGEEV